MYLKSVLRIFCMAMIMKGFWIDPCLSWHLTCLRNFSKMGCSRWTCREGGKKSMILRVMLEQPNASIGWMWPMAPRLSIKVSRWVRKLVRYLNLVSLPDMTLPLRDASWTRQFMVWWESSESCLTFMWSSKNSLEISGFKITSFQVDPGRRDGFCNKWSPLNILNSILSTINFTWG